MDNPTKNLIPRSAVEYICRKETVSTNPNDFTHSEKFIRYLDHDAISSFGRWQWANGFNTALVAVKCGLDKIPTIEPESAKPHRWTPVSSDSMPEDGVTVWVTIQGHDVILCEDGETLEQAVARISKIRWVTQGYWSEEEHGWNDPSFGCPLMVQPIAWMPIDTPEPWKGEEP